MADDTKEMFVLHNLYRLFERPQALQDRIFQRLFDQAEIARYSESERRQYEESKKVFWDNYSVLKTATEKGLREGLEKGRREGMEEGRREGMREGVLQEKSETVQRMLSKGFSVEDIAEIAGLTIEEVRKLVQ